MDWEQILGFFTMWLHPEITAGLWSSAEVPFWQTFLLVTAWTSMTLMVTYFGVGLVELLLKLFWRAVKKVIRVFKKDFNEFKKSGLQIKSERYQGRLINWLNRQKNWVVLLCSSIPFIWGLPVAVIIVTKAAKIKYGLPILLAGNVLRNAAICLTIYYGPTLMKLLSRIFS